MKRRRKKRIEEQEAALLHMKTMMRRRERHGKRRVEELRGARRSRKLLCWQKSEWDTDTKLAPRLALFRIL